MFGKRRMGISTMDHRALNSTLPGLAKHDAGTANRALFASSISIVIPALNEETVVEGVVRDISDQVAAAFTDYEIILIDDGSTDKTGEIIDRLTTELPNARA